MKIENICFQNLPNDEHFQFYCEFLSLIYKFDANVLNISNEFASFMLVFEKEAAINEAKLNRLSKGLPVNQHSDQMLEKFRLQVDDAYHAIIERIRALVLIEGDEGYCVFIRNLNGIIFRFTASPERRHKRRNRINGNHTGTTNIA